MLPDARGVTTTYSYDALNRLIGVAYPDPNLDIGYSYDVAPAACAADERFAKGRLGQVLHANRSTQDCHDRFGQITLKVQTINGVASTLRYAYSKAGRLTALTYPDGSVADYVRDPLGRISQVGLTRPGQARRVLRTPAGGTAQITLYDEAGQWLGNYSASGEAQQQAIWLDNYPVALINVPAAGVPELAYIQPDHLGTPRVVIDPVRDVAIWEWSNKSEVFGNQIPSADPDGDGVAFELALRFPGQQATDASGMFYNYQREYDPAVGRYSQSDPIGLMGGISSYAYANSGPVGISDPSGMIAKCTCNDGGASIDIPIRFRGEMATPEKISEIIRSIESTWSSPGFTVTVSQPAKGRANDIEIVPGVGVSFVRGSSEGRWYSDMNPWTAAHEAGHLMKFKYDGRVDMYDVTNLNPRTTSPVPGWEGNIMAEHLGLPDDRVRDAIKRALRCK